MRAIWLTLLVGCAVLPAAPVRAEEEEEPRVDKAALIETLIPSFAAVEYTLQYDKGEAPVAAGDTVEEYVNDENPFAIPAYALSPTRVLAPDPGIHPRFIKAIHVVQNGRKVPARVAGYARHRSALLFELEQPLADAKPLSFDVNAEPPYFRMTYHQDGGQWCAEAESFAMDVIKKGNAAPRAHLADGVVVSATGAAIAVSLEYDDALPPDGQWQGSPLDWDWISAEEMAARLAELEHRTNDSVLRVKLKFRNPSQQAGQNRRYRRYDNDDNGAAIEMDALGLLLDKERALVLADLQPKLTARLEKVQVYRGDRQINAVFAGSMENYRALLVRLETPADGATIILSDKPITAAQSQLLYCADISLRGEEVVRRFFADRLDGDFYLGWRDQLAPDLANSGMAFVFDGQGALVALPLSRRAKTLGDSGYSNYSYRGGSGLHAAKYVRDDLADAAKSADPNNTPLAEEQENRLAWLGVTLQALDADLAREHKISELTQNGSFGAMVSYVWPDSPAAAAGIEPGMILLRLIAEGYPAPWNIKVGEDAFGEGSFPWDRYDMVTEDMFDDIPQPWPSARGGVAEALTRIGFGKKYEIEIYHDGAIVTRGFTVEESPPYFDSAPRFKAENLGLTARDLTYEARRYFMRKPDAPGVIVSKVEKGGKASVAGVKPYEIITHVNEQPVNNVKEFEAAIKDAAEPRLSVVRMNKSRTVKIKLDNSARKAAPVAPESPAETAVESRAETAPEAVPETPAQVPPPLRQ